MDKAFEYLNFEQGSANWLEMRLCHITASNVAAIMGKCPYKTALQYATELVTKTSTDKPNYIFAKGHELEAKSRDWVKKHFEMDLPPAVVRSLKYPYLVASLDGIHEETKHIFEAKLMGKEKLAVIKESGVMPENHFIQIQTQLMITGYPTAIYFAGDLEGDTQLLTVAADTAWHEKIHAAIQPFWGMVNTGDLPEPTERDIREVKDTRFKDIAQLHHMIKDLSDKLDALKKTVIDDYPDATPLRCDGVTVTRHWYRRTIDWYQLAADKMIDNKTLEKYRKKGSVLRPRFSFKQEK